jgi:hypothetical protein
VGGTHDRSGKIANFIGVASSTGSMAGVIRTNPYVPKRVCANENGKLWTYGWERDPENWSAEAKEYPMVREFSTDGRQLRSGINRSLYPLQTVSGQPAEVSLRCTQNSVVLLLGGAGKLFVFNKDNGQASVFDVPRVPPGVSQFTGFAAIESGEMFATITDLEKNVSGLYRLQKNAQRGEWIPYGDDADLGPGLTRLMGSQGNSLILVKFPEYTATWKAVRP